MYILSSDYDGTLKTRIIDLRMNINELRKYRDLGNIFILNTGRPYKSIKAEIEEFKIPFDYLCCNDGAVIFDKHLDVVKETKLTNDQVKFVKNLVPHLPGFKVAHYYAAKEISESEIPDVIEVEIKKEPQADFKELTDMMQVRMRDTIQFIWKNSLFVKSNVTKSKALDELIKIIDPNIDPATIYTVGDEANDVEMIKNHHGFRMLESSPKLWTSTWRVLPEVHYLVKYLNFKSKRSNR